MYVVSHAGESGYSVLVGCLRSLVLELKFDGDPSTPIPEGLGFTEITEIQDSLPHDSWNVGKTPDVEHELHLSGILSTGSPFSGS